MPTITRRDSEIDDEPLLARKRAVVVPAGSAFLLPWAFRDAAGRAVDLSPLAPQADPPEFPPARLRLAEAVLAAAGTREYAGSLAVAAPGAAGSLYWTPTLPAPFGLPNPEPTPGGALFRIPGDAALAAGVYRAEAAACRASDGGPEILDAFDVYVEPSLFSGLPGPGTGPPLIRDVRVRVRDSSPAENRLLDELQFDDAEIAHAVVRTVRHYNDVPPLLAPVDTTNFPFPDLWLVGIRATLFEIASDWYRKNHLATSAGGIAVEDMAKARDFEAAAGRELDKWRSDVRARKAVLNVAGGFGSTAGRYRWYGGRGCF